LLAQAQKAVDGPRATGAPLDLSENMTDEQMMEQILDLTK